MFNDTIEVYRLFVFFLFLILCGIDLELVFTVMYKNAVLIVNGTGLSDILSNVYIVYIVKCAHLFSRVSFLRIHYSALFVQNKTIFI